MLSSRIVLFSVAFWLALGALADRPRMEAAEPNAGRDLSLHHAAGPTARAAQEPGDSDPQTPWYRRLIVGMEVGPTGAQWGIDPTDTGYAARFNGHDVVQQQLAANSQYLVIWGKDSEYAYYDSKVAPKCPGLGSRDVLKEAVESARAHRLPVIVYCVVQGNGYPLRQHPEYRMLDSGAGRSTASVSTPDTWSMPSGLWTKCWPTESKGSTSTCSTKASGRRTAVGARSAATSFGPSTAARCPRASPGTPTGSG